MVPPVNHNPSGGYIADALFPEPRARAVERVLAALDTVAFDSIVVRGVSGCTLGAIVADRLGKPLVVVRKKHESCHSHFAVEGPLGQRYVIVDDLIESGATVKMIVQMVAGCSPASACVGFAGYSALYWPTRDDLDHQTNAERCHKAGVPYLAAGRAPEPVPTPEPVTSGTMSSTMVLPQNLGKTSSLSRVSKTWITVRSPDGLSGAREETAEEAVARARRQSENFLAQGRQAEAVMADWADRWQEYAAGGEVELPAAVTADLEAMADRVNACRVKPVKLSAQWVERDGETFLGLPTVRAGAGP